MESFRPAAPGAGAAGSCGCGTRCPALIGGSCRCGCACLLDSRDARLVLAEQVERDRQAAAKNHLQNPPLKDDDAAAAARALTALSGPPRQQEPAALQAVKKKGGSCCEGNAGGGAQHHQQPAASTAVAACCGGNADGQVLEQEDAHDAELEGIAAVVAAAVGAPLAGECAELFLVSQL